MIQGRGRWDLLALATFLIVLVGCAGLIEQHGGIALIESFTLFDLTLVALAAFRLLHLITYDKIFAFVRDYFDRRGRDDAAPGHRYIDSFLECLWCTGIWSALFIFTAYSISMWGKFVVIIFAVAGVASLLQLISHAVAGQHE